MDNSPLKRLPAELRNEISKLVLDHDGCLQVRYNEWPARLVIEDSAYHSNPSWPDPYRLALAQTCKQLRGETKGLFFSTNYFIV